MASQSKIEILSVGRQSPWLTAGLEARFHVHQAGDLPLADPHAVRIVVTNAMAGLDKATMDAMPALELIAIHGVGLDAVDLDHARARGIRVTNTPDVLNDDVADMAVGLTLATMRRLAFNDRFVRDGRWAQGEAAPLGRRLTGARIGILGLGRIGTAIAERLRGFTPHIAYHNRKPVPGSAYLYVDGAQALARQSDVLIVAASGGIESRHVVDAAVLDALGADGILVNIARGSAVDQVALVECLVAGRLGGAGLDVFADEPDVPAALLALDTVVLQPHQASATTETRKDMADLVLANVDAFLRGAALPSEVV